MSKVKSTRTPFYQEEDYVRRRIEQRIDFGYGRTTVRCVFPLNWLSEEITRPIVEKFFFVPNPDVPFHQWELRRRRPVLDRHNYNDGQVWQPWDRSEPG